MVNKLCCESKKNRESFFTNANEILFSRVRENKINLIASVFV